ncbi:hypothetical protein D0Z00_002564 [Geotrichum galactomycetum]|uniref:Uncharacterized protein n=1 Tax=Geotrichum galactomycetum TaxID=27317 RepID=A0ACB6V3T0_9ASCO|nr:hypothetical protein D0Z00_002564 [Geotrichum candidum]
MWAFPQQIVPLSFQLHQELAEEYNGAIEWGYRGLKTLCIEGDVSPTNLRNIANQKTSKKPAVDLPEDLNWINTAIIDGWAHLGGADSTAQVHPYKFTLFILKKVLETGAVDLISGKATEIVTNDKGEAVGIKYTTFIDKQNSATRAASAVKNTPPSRKLQTPSSPTINKSSLHHPDNPTFNNQTQKLNPIQQPSSNISISESSSDSSLSSTSTITTSGIHGNPNTSSTNTNDNHHDSYINNSDLTTPSSVKSASSISTENSSNIFTDDDQRSLDESITISEESNDDENDNIIPPQEQPVPTESASVEEGEKSDDGLKYLEGDQIVLTLGPWTSKILPSCPISGLRAHSITIQPSKSVSPFALFTEMRTSRTSYVSPEIYPRKDEVYVCGEGDTAAGVPESTDDVEVLRDRCDELFKNVGYISPQLKNGRILKRQACYLPVVDVPSHSGPFIGNTNVENLYLASGHSCWGINNAPGTGLLMAELLLDGEATSASLDGLEPEFYFDASSNELPGNEAPIM